MNKPREFLNGQGDDSEVFTGGYSLKINGATHHCYIVTDRNRRLRSVTFYDRGGRVGRAAKLAQLETAFASALHQEDVRINNLMMET